MLNYEGKYSEAGDAWQSSVAVLRAATRAWSSDASTEQLTMSYCYVLLLLLLKK